MYDFFIRKIEFLADQTIIPSNGPRPGVTKPNEIVERVSQVHLQVFLFNCLFIILNNKIY